MHPNEQLIHTFYHAFSERDPAGMIACYHPRVVFSDPAFTHLEGAEVGAMWTMLCARGYDLVVRHNNVTADDRRGSASWEAAYSFSKTGRLVSNRVSASFEFEDGKIIRHADVFDFWRWARMALGPTGILFGWSPPLKAAVRKQAMGQLRAFMARQR